jgi:hypothetical protein
MGKKSDDNIDKARDAAITKLFGSPEDRAEEFAANLNGELDNIMEKVAKKPIKKLDEPTVLEGAIDPVELDKKMRQKAMERDGANAEELSDIAKDIVEDK